MSLSLYSLYEAYSFNVIPNLGHILASDRDSYQCKLSSSVVNCPILPVDFEIRFIYWRDMEKKPNCPLPLFRPRRIHSPVSTPSPICANDPRRRLSSFQSQKMGRSQFWRRIHSQWGQTLNSRIVNYYRWHISDLVIKFHSQWWRQLWSSSCFISIKRLLNYPRQDLYSLLDLLAEIDVANTHMYNQSFKATTFYLMTLVTKLSMIESLNQVLLCTQDVHR